MKTVIALALVALTGCAANNQYGQLDSETHTLKPRTKTAEQKMCTYGNNQVDEKCVELRLAGRDAIPAGQRHRLLEERCEGTKDRILYTNGFNVCEPLSVRDTSGPIPSAVDKYNSTDRSTVTVGNQRYEVTTTRYGSSVQQSVKRTK